MFDFDSLVSRASAPAPSETSRQRLDPNEAFRGDQGASELLGDLSRAQWEDWKNRFSPYVDRLADVAQDSGAPAQAARNASNAMASAFDSNQQAQAQQRQGLGISQTPAQAQSQDRQQALGRTASMVSAGNQARVSAQDRQSAILAGGMGLSNIPDKVMDS